MNDVVILGANGAVGWSLIPELERRGIKHRAVGRHAGALMRRFGESPLRTVVEADVSDSQSVRRAVGGADTVIYLVGVPYDHFELHPKYMRSTLEAVTLEGVARFLHVGPVYPYGRPQTRPVSELHPRVPTTFKGKMRLAQEELVFGAHRTGRIATAIVRLPDFYGPFIENSFAYRILTGALNNKAAEVIGPLDTPHEFIYVPDAAPAILDLAARTDAYGDAYNLAGPGTITVREFARLAYAALGREPRFVAANKTMLRLFGVVNPMMRELVEMYYLWTDPVILDDGKLQRVLGPLQKHSYEEGIRASIEAMRQKVAA